MTRYKLFINFPFICFHQKITPREYFGDLDTMIQAQIATYRDIGLPPSISPDFGLIMESSAFGAAVHYDDNGFPSSEQGIFSSLEEAVNQKPIDPLQDGLMPKVLDALRYMKAHAPDGVPVRGVPISGMFTTAATLRGISDFCLDVFDDGEFVEKFLTQITACMIGFVREQEKIIGPSDYVLITDDTSAFLNPEMFELFVAPTYKRFMEAFPNMRHWLHNDANASHLAQAICNCGFALWHIGDCIDIDVAMRASTGTKIMGNLPPALVRTGTVKEVYAASAALCERFACDDRFVLSIGGFANYGTPVENLQAIIQCANDH